MPHRDQAELENSTKKGCTRKTCLGFRPPRKTLSDSSLLEIHDQDELFLGNTFSTDPKSAHFQKPPLISTILACHYWNQPRSKKAPTSSKFTLSRFQPLSYMLPRIGPRHKLCTQIRTKTRKPDSKSVVYWGGDERTRRLFRISSEPAAFEPPFLNSAAFKRV